MAKINIPIGENGGKDYTDESTMLNKLITNTARTTTGTCSFTSKSSGLYYSTDDHPDDSEIYGKGDLGMIKLLRKLYGGSDGWIVMADDLNEKQNCVVSEVITLAAGGWTGTQSPYKQGFTSQYVDANTRIDLFMDSALFAQMAADKVNALYAENNNGVASVVAIGNKPSVDISIQADYTKVKI